MALTWERLDAKAAAVGDDTTPPATPTFNPTEFKD
jgi:hypothetical protein